MKVNAKRNACLGSGISDVYGGFAGNSRNSLLKVFTAVLCAAMLICTTPFAYASEMTFNSYNEVLDRYSFYEYAVCDINNDGSKELIAGEGGSSGYVLYSYYNGEVRNIADIGCNSTMYIYNNALYDICFSLFDVTSTYVSHEIWMTKYTLSDGVLQSDVLYYGIHKSIDYLKDDTFSTIPEISNIMNNGTKINFVSTDDRSLLYDDTPIKIILNGERLYFEKSPQIVNGRTLVPLRAIFEAMGARVYWDSAEKTVISIKDSTMIKMTIGNSTLCRNNIEIELDVPPQLIDSYTMVPVRAVAEAFGATVDWDENNKTVYISSSLSDYFAQGSQNTISSNALIGSWEIDNEKTMSVNNVGMTDLFGSKYSRHGSNMTLDNNGSFSWRAGEFRSYTGTYSVDGSIVNYSTYDEYGDNYEGILFFDNNNLYMELFDEFGQSYLSYLIYWKKL